MIPNREGLFNAYPAEIGVDETGPNKLATCIIRFKLYQELQASGEWDDCAADNLEITGYFYLEKKDGALNTITVDSLKAALGWDGRDPFWLQTTDLSQHAVQLKLAFEEFNGKTRWHASGQWQGFNSAMQYFPEERFGVIILCNWISGWVNPVA